MPYITRNPDNTIAQFCRNAPPSVGWETIEENDPAVVAFLEAILNPVPTADLNGLVDEFTVPGSSTLYASIAAKIAVANQFAITDHWQNLKLLLDKRDPTQQSKLSLGINYLAYLLSQAGQAFSQSDRDAWNALCDRYHLDPVCKIAAPEQLNAQFEQAIGI